MNPQDCTFPSSPSDPELIPLSKLSSKPKRLISHEWLQNNSNWKLIVKPKKVKKAPIVTRQMLTYEGIIRILEQYLKFCLLNNKSLDWKELTPNCVWFIISASYFSRGEYVLKGKTPTLILSDLLNDLASIRCPLRALNVEYSVEDDLFLSDIKRKAHSLLTFDIDALITSYENELENLAGQNREKINGFKTEMEREYAYLTPILDYASRNPYNILIDLHNTSLMEQEFFDYLEHKQHDPSNFSLESLLSSSSWTMVMDSQDILCQICNDGDYTEDNLIVFCSKCNIAVHQKCYEITFVPDGDWVCELCKAFGSANARNLRCPLCSRRGGAMKPTVFSIEELILKGQNESFTEFQEECISKPGVDLERGKREEPRPDKIWVHLSCALWLPEIYFDENLEECNIKGLDALKEWRFSICCAVCKMKRIGAVVQCAGYNCSGFFHVECARRAGMFLETIEMKFLLYCDKHIPLKLKRVLVARSLKARDEILSFCKGLRGQLYRFHDKIRNKIGIKRAKKLGLFDMVAENKEARRRRKFRRPSHCFLIRLRKLEESQTFQLDGVSYPKFLKKREEQMLRKGTETNDTTRRFAGKRKKQQRMNFIRKPKKAIQKKKNTRDRKKKLIRKSGLNSKSNTHLSVETTQSLDDEPLVYVRDSPNHESPPVVIEDEATDCDVQIMEGIPEDFPRERPADVKRFCVCLQRFDGKDDMICCQSCEEWFHFKCIGFKGDIKAAENLRFVCKSCDSLDSEANRILRREETEFLFEDYYERIQPFPRPKIFGSIHQKKLKKNLGYNIMKHSASVKKAI